LAVIPDYNLNQYTGYMFFLIAWGLIFTGSVCTCGRIVKNCVTRQLVYSAD
jgi:hypothetical protein